MPERLRTLLIGTDGAGGQDHQRLMYAPVLLAHEAYEVVGVADDAGAAGAEQNRSRELAGDLGVPYLGDLTGVDGEVDLACVCTPYERRETVVSTLAGKGVHLLVDKPLGLSADSARAMAASIEGRDVVAMPAHHLRFHPSVQRAAAAVALGDIGLPWAMQGEFLPAGGTQAWPHGELANFLCYPLDIVRAVLALEPAKVAAWRSSPFFGGAHEDLAVLSLTFDHDIPVSLTVGRTSLTAHRNGPLGEHRYRVMGTEGVLTVDLAEPSLRLDGPVSRRPFGRGSLDAMADHLAAAIMGEVRPALDFSDAVVVSDLVDAARAAADQNRVVELDRKDVA